MSVDAELDAWRQQWQSDTAAPLDLRKRVERQSRLMKLGLVANILVTVVIGGATTGWAIESPQPDIVLLTAMTWMFLAVAWTVDLAANRGKWSASTLETAACLDLSISRCRARLAAIRFGFGLAACELVFCLGWLYHHLPQPRKPILAWLFSSVAMGLVWLFMVAFFGCLVWYYRRKRSELACYFDLRGLLVGQAIMPAAGFQPAGRAGKRVRRQDCPPH